MLSMQCPRYLEIAKERQKISFGHDNGMAKYLDQILPRSTELCVAHILGAFEELGCGIRGVICAAVLVGTKGRG